MRVLPLLAALLIATLALAATNGSMVGTNTGDVILADAGSGSPNYLGASIVSGPNFQVLTLQCADALHPGLACVSPGAMPGPQMIDGGLTVATGVQANGATPQFNCGNTTVGCGLQASVLSGNASLGAFQFATNHTLSGAPDLMAVFLNNGSFVWQLDKSGNVVSTGKYDSQSATAPQFNCLSNGAPCVFQSGGAQPVEMVSGISSGGASSGAIQLNSQNTLSGASDLLVVANNNSATQWQIDKSGNETVQGGFTSASTTSPQFQCTGAGNCTLSQATTRNLVLGNLTTAATGASGGVVNLVGQSAGSGSGTTPGGTGGTLTLQDGPGGPGGTSGAAGNAGGWTYSGSTGGGAGSTTGAAGTGGNVSLTLGAGGPGTAGLAAGIGGGFTLTTGAGGTNNGGGGGASGNLSLDVGAATGAATAGTASFCATNASTCTVGGGSHALNLNGNATFGTAGPSLGGTLTGSFSLMSGTNAAMGTNVSADLFEFTSSVNNVKFRDVSCVTETTAGSGTNGTLALWDNTGSSALCSATFPCTGAAGGVGLHIMDCNAAPTSGHTYSLRLTTACGTTNPTGLKCNVEIQH